MTRNCLESFDFPESGDGLVAVIDGVAAAATTSPQYLPGFEPGDDGFDARPDPARPVAVVADDPAGMVAA
jgi:hypothetical protein